MTAAAEGAATKQLYVRAMQIISSREGKRRAAGALAACLVAGGAYSLWRIRQQQINAARAARRAGKQQGGTRQPRRSSTNSLHRLIKFLLPIAGKRILVLLALAVARTALSNRLAKLQGYLFRAAFLRRVPLFARNLVENVALCLVASGVESTSRRVLAHLELTWRAALTARLQRHYFDNMTYYKLSYVDRRITTPEQRLCEDVPKLATGLAELLRDCLNAALDAGFYAVALRRYSGTNIYSAAMAAYVVGAGAATSLLAPNFGRLFKKAQELEGTYRQLHARLRANAESVAFYQGISKEGATIKKSFKELVAHHARLLSRQWEFGMVQDFLLKYLGATAAVVLIIGPFFGGHLRPSDDVLARAGMLSNMRYHTSVVISLFGALGTLAASSKRFMKLGAYADRVCELEDTVRDVAAGHTSCAAREATGEILPVEDEIAFEGAMVVTPANATLVKDLTLRVPAGTNLLVTGPNGAGKSSLFRVLGGLWPLTRGCIRKPGGGGGEDGLSHEIFYVPQRPYVTLGTLQEQLIYPLTLPEGGGDVLGEEELRALLAAVDLTHLLQRRGVVDWGEALSLGEQQRLGMARLFYHQPKFAILDECTSGVTVDMEERFCEMVKALGCTCITISHRPALVAFHDLVLALDGEGGWSLHAGARAAASPSRARSLARAVTDAQHDGGDGAGKQRGSDAVAVLEGMQKAVEDDRRLKASSKAAKRTAKRHGSQAGRTSASPARDQEEEVVDAQGTRELVVAQAPPPEAVPRASGGVPPSLALRPARLSSWQRWQSVLRVLGGRGQGLQLGTIATVVALRTLLQDRIASLNGRSVDLVLKQDKEGFIRLIGVSVLQSAASAVLAPSLRHVAEALALAWRRRLTAAVHARYLQGNTFYSVAELAGMQDVDQRITRDVERLADDLAALIPTMVKPVVDLLWFSAQLWRLTGRRGMAILYLYSLLGFACLRALTPDFGALAAKEYGLEGAFRAVHQRLRTHAESIAFFGGGAREGSIVTRTFADLMAHLRRMVTLRWAHSVADDFFSKQLPFNVTWALTLLYALDQTGDYGDTAVQGRLVHNMRYLASVVSQCFSAFGELLALNKRFAELGGGVTRVSELLETVGKAHRLAAATATATSDAAPSTTGKAGEDDCIAFERVDVATPAGKVLARQLTCRVQRGSSLLVTGPNASGKSSLFRILGGLWPLHAGRVVHPPAGRTRGIYYVPQKPYTTVGTLREQVIYPLSVSAAASSEPGDSEAERLAALDVRLAGLMEVVRLRYLLEREGGWAATAEWGEQLSLGEQQRLGMARLFYARPRFGVLDECTNATSVDVEERLYEHAAALGITLVTITQRTALVRFHAHELRLLDGEGGWQLRAILPPAGLGDAEGQQGGSPAPSPRAAQSPRVQAK